MTNKDRALLVFNTIQELMAAGYDVTFHHETNTVTVKGNNVFDHEHLSLLTNADRLKVLERFLGKYVG